MNGGTGKGLSLPFLKIEEGKQDKVQSLVIKRNKGMKFHPIIDEVLNEMKNKTPESPGKKMVKKLAARAFRRQKIEEEKE